MVPLVIACRAMRESSTWAKTSTMAFPIVTTSRGDEDMSGESSSHPLHFLIGVWRGEGKAEYPGTTDFAYGEELTISQPPGRPVLSYIQKTWSLTDGSLTHAE